MEEKIYDRQVTKQSLSARVVDEQQIERHFTMNELAELYTFNDEPKVIFWLLWQLVRAKIRLEFWYWTFFVYTILNFPHFWRTTLSREKEREIQSSVNKNVQYQISNLFFALISFLFFKENQPTIKVPQDKLLAELVLKHKDNIWKIHDHDSLLENQVDEHLTEEERKAAWEEFENEKKGIINMTNSVNLNQNLVMSQINPEMIRVRIFTIFNKGKTRGKNWREIQIIFLF